MDSNPRLNAEARERSPCYQRLLIIEKELIGVENMADAAFPGMVHYLAGLYLTTRNCGRSPKNVRGAICWAIDIIEAAIDKGAQASGKLDEVDGRIILRHVATKALEELGA